MPGISHERDHLMVSGLFSRVMVKLEWNGAHEVIMIYEFTVAQFQPRWANPLWQFVELELETERVQVTQLLARLLDHMPPSRLIHLRINDSEVLVSPDERWKLKVEQAVRAGTILLQFAFMIIQAMYDRLSRGWGLVMAGVLFPISLGLLMVRVVWHWVRDTMGQVATG